MLSHSVVYLFNQMKCKSWKIYRLIVVDKWKPRYCFKIIMKKVFQHLCTVRASFNFLIACSNFHGISYSNLYSLLVVFARLFVCLKERNAVHQAWRCIGWILNEQQFNFKTLQKFHWSFFSSTAVWMRLIFDERAWNKLWCGRLYAMDKKICENCLMITYFVWSENIWLQSHNSWLFRVKCI